MISAVSLMLFLIPFYGASYALIPKCFRMEAEIHHLWHSLFSEINITTPADDYEPYDPEYESDELFRTKQCNNSEVCWCVDSEGVRQSHDRHQCEDPVLPTSVWVRMEIKHKETSDPLELVQLQRAIVSANQIRDDADPNLDSNTALKYDVDSRLISVEIKKNSDAQKQDLSLLAYYMKKNVAVQSLFNEQTLEPTVKSETLEIESIVVYYVDEKRPTNSMQTLTTGLLSVTGVFILAVCVGLLILFLIRRQKKGQYEKAQTSEIEEI